MKLFLSLVSWLVFASGVLAGLAGALSVTRTVPDPAFPPGQGLLAVAFAAALILCAVALAPK